MCVGNWFDVLLRATFFDLLLVYCLSSYLSFRLHEDPNSPHGFVLVIAVRLGSEQVVSKYLWNGSMNEYKRWKKQVRNCELRYRVSRGEVGDSAKERSREKKE